ncbi:hypothetical protein NPIL_402421 [Nephila pilipes]|uniref:Uncharacterized protein n=1 Tax=Nephila pilipes TaxID=299642 RepID=A0A8X6NP21_NEPPI|nr:hypothetical protein NPIL_402421 [Nephila pilipes]
MDYSTDEEGLPDDEMKVIIRGLPADCDQNELLNEILALGPQPQHISIVKIEEITIQCPCFSSFLSRTLGLEGVLPFC